MPIRSARTQDGGAPSVDFWAEEFAPRTVRADAVALPQGVLAVPPAELEAMMEEIEAQERLHVASRERESRFEEERLDAPKSTARAEDPSELRAGGGPGPGEGPLSALAGAAGPSGAAGGSSPASGKHLAFRPVAGAGGAMRADLGRARIHSARHHGPSRADYHSIRQGYT